MNYKVPDSPIAQNPDISAGTRDIYTVTRLNREVRSVLEESFPPLWVQGELSNLAQPASGHMYFSLKDKDSQVRCAMFKNRNRFLKFEPQNGLEVIIKANVSIYEGRGEFQLIVDVLEPAGIGALQKAFEQLTEKLQKEGLFEDKNKKPLPAFPKSIGIITSRSGAALRDILHVLKRRYPLAKIIIYPVMVQGSDAVSSIVSAIATANRRKENEVIILARGGGSLEDLWSFNEEPLARAIFASALPIVCGVGHEIDFTIADFVADKRAATPSAAAELVSPDKTKLLDSVALIRGRFVKSINRLLSDYRQQLKHYLRVIPNPGRLLQSYSQRLDGISLKMLYSIRSTISIRHSHMEKLRAQIGQFNPINKFKIYRGKNDYLYSQLRTHMRARLNVACERLDRSGHTLHAISPLATLDRGYAIVTRTENGKIVKDIKSLNSGDETTTEIRNGFLFSRIMRLKKK
jgi:exodeoxyribonuclease VII large subunit